MAIANCRRILLILTLLLCGGCASSHLKVTSDFPGVAQQTCLAFDIVAPKIQCHTGESYVIVTMAERKTTRNGLIRETCGYKGECIPSGNLTY